MKCKICKKIFYKKWFYCPKCGQQLKKIRLIKGKICSRCGLERYRHDRFRPSNIDRLYVCNDFKIKKENEDV